jgi:amino acid transporter
MATSPQKPSPTSETGPSLPPPHRYDSSLGALRAFLFGRPLASAHTGHQRLPVVLALPIFSSDALSSVAYATEAILGVLILVGTGAMRQSLGIAIAICTLIWIVALSYRQIIAAYPNGGGAYPVAKENLGTIPALVAGAALLVDYILTVAVSVASGVDAIGSFSSAGVSFLQILGSWVNLHKSEVCLICTAAIMLANLRGVKESGAIFAFPAYVFITSFVVLIAKGFIGLFTGHIHPLTLAQSNVQAHAMGFNTGFQLAGWYLVLQAFSSGCSALTGMEAISNTVPYFKEPRDKNAQATMTWMALIATFFFGGITYLSYIFHSLPIDPKASDYQTVISQIAHTVFDNTGIAWFYYVVQISTAIILILAANTAFAGFPQLSAMLARDRFLPRQLASVGDRLVYANGIVILALVSAILLVIFQGNVYELIPLYAVGVFTSFTLAQAGMVRHWLHDKRKGWQYSIFLNGLGAVATAVVAIIFVVSKWSSGVVISPSLRIPTDGVWQWYGGQINHLPLHAYRHWQHIHPGHVLPGYTIGPGLTPHYGAWLVAVLIPLLVMMFRKIETHYEDVRKQLSLRGYEPKPAGRHIVLVLVPGLNRGVVDALRYASMISGDCRAFYIEIDESVTPGLKQNWEKWANDIPLLILASPYRSLIGPVRRYIDAVQKERAGDVVTVVLPEFVSPKWWHNFLHNQAGLLLKLTLLNRRGIVVTNVRYFLSQNTP